MSKLLEDKRKTRGLRMAALVGEAAEQDDMFWNSEVWAEEESDASSFVEEEIKPDVFDSDFDESEDDNEEDDDDSQPKRDKTKVTNVNRYKEPGKVLKPPIKKVVTNEGSTATIKKQDTCISITDEILTREVRTSTKAKTIDVDQRLKASESTSSLIKKDVSKQLPKPRFTQKELLQDALETEKLNKTWLESQKFYLQDTTNDDITHTDKMNKLRGSHASSSSSGNNGIIRKLSRRGTYNTITFTDENILPSILYNNNEVIPQIPAKVCVITGLPARYKDPKTQLPYYDLNAYKQIQEKYHMNI